MRVLRLVQALGEQVAFLDREAGAGSQRRADPIWSHAVKYAFVSGIEACLDIAQHICSSERWGPPSNNADAMRVLARHGVLSPELAAHMVAAVGFRNILVHEYIDVDEAIVLARVADHADLDDFAVAIAAFVGPPRRS